MQWGSEWAPASQAASVLHLTRKVISAAVICTFLLCDIMSAFLGSNQGPKIAKVICKSNQIISLSMIGRSGFIEQELSRCLAGSATKIAGFVVFIDKIFMSIVSGIISMALLIILLSIQRQKTSFGPSTIWTKDRLYIIYGRFCLLPAIPFVLTGYLLHAGPDPRMGLLMDFVYTCDAFIIHTILANFITPTFAVRLDPTEFATQLPPAT